MSIGPQDSFDPRLLDLHLGHLSESERGELRRRLAEDPRLAGQSAALESVLTALDSWAHAPMPADLRARVVARVRAAGPAPRLWRASDQLTEHLERTATRVLPLRNLADIVAVAAMIVLAVGIGVPSMLHMRERQQRLGCSYNLAQVGGAIQQYTSTFNASLPFAGWGPGSSWQPESAAGAATMPNRRHIYLLLSRSFVLDPRVFVCPAQPHVPMSPAAVSQHADFLEARNLSYAYQNMAGVRPSANDDPRLPVLVDENPLFEDGRLRLDLLRLRDPDRTNSRAHRGAGQNLLTLRGEVKWVTTPLAGVDGDNIWTLRGVSDYTGREGPLAATDSHLLK